MSEVAGSDMERMLAAVRACLEPWETWSAPVSIATSREIKFRAGFPLAAHALNHVAVALEVYGRYPLVAASGARIALESSLAAQWVLLTRQGEQVLIKHMEAQYLTRVRSFRAAAGEQVGLADVAAREAAPGRERQWTAQQLFERFSDSDLFYDIYRELTGAVHPSYETLLAHLNLGDITEAPRINRGGRLRRQQRQRWRWRLCSGSTFSKGV